VNVLLEVHYHDREELGPLEPPLGVAVGPVVLGGSRLPGALWSTVSSTMTTRPFTSLTGPPVPPRVVEFSQRLQQVCVVQPERLGRVPHASPPTYQGHQDKCKLTFLLLPFLLTTPSLFTALTSLSLANSICPFPHLFSRTTLKNFSLIQAFRITSLRFP
jgi:hypothetical protein